MLNRVYREIIFNGGSCKATLQKYVITDKVSLFILLSIIVDFIGMFIFTIFHVDANFQCYLFCNIDARHRRLDDGYGICCIFLYVIWFISGFTKYFVFKKRINNSVGDTYKVIKHGGVCLGDIFRIVLIYMGIHATCQYALKHSGIGRCTRVAFARIDFFTFEQKYSHGFSFPNDQYYAMGCTSLSLVLWLLAIHKI